MSTGLEIVLRWRFVPQVGDRDMRTFNIFFEYQAGVQPIHLFKFLTLPGAGEQVTTFERWNLVARRWEIAGEVHWVNNFSGQVQFGINIMQLSEVRRRRRQGGLSRRFTANGLEFRWKIAGNGTDLICLNSQNQIVATWTHGESTLRVSMAAEHALDRIVVTCLVNLWFKTHQRW